MGGEGGGGEGGYRFVKWKGGRGGGGVKKVEVPYHLFLY